MQSRRIELCDVLQRGVKHGYTEHGLFLQSWDRYQARVVLISSVASSSMDVRCLITFD